ncbi:2Fe-2S iron-sulfur cluster-binding protein [Thioalbus denitrificans]|uniref:Ferredoxin-NADP reductase n=1 Tax=Thioalbus denitrificans TaxID=547122 RepID=A0A369CCA7_9GAMM|nr:2Fe-2S iron-sulfur cluster-binding protein [Thioalbus denitrificans]RCX30257.1 hypothetical protein DFQ59_10589 [Thioalbus denitrificans]
MSTGTLALIILAAILAQVAAAVLIGFRRRRKEHQEPGVRGAPPAISPHTPPTAATRTPAALPAWEGFREFTVQRREYEDANRTVCSFYLAPVDGKPLPPFRPGQFLTFRLSVEDPETRELGTVIRCYSLSDAPRPDHYRVSIKRVPAPPGHPDAPPGLASGFFHDRVHEGSRLLVRAPSGHFHLQEDEPLPIVLIGGGIGITPMLSILDYVLGQGDRREVWLYYGVRNGNEHIMKERLLGLAGTHAGFHLHVCYSAPRENDVEGVDYQHCGRIDMALLRNTLKLMRYQFYVCGPRPLMESLVPALEAWGVDSGDIHYESFGPAALPKHGKTAPVAAPSAGPATITFSRSGRRIDWDPAAGSLLGLAEANGIEVMSGCRVGSCGSCQTALSAGEVEYSQDPDAEIAPGHCLPCIATPRGDLTLEA